jgi:hypothetical protein
MEMHKRQFRGEWIPADILDLFENSTITATELLLLVTVDSLVHPERGCWATNDYLGGKVQTTPDHVRRMLRKLERLGLIIKTTTNNNRSMETAWSRVTLKTPLDRTPLGGRAFAPGGAGINARQSITERENTEAGSASPPTAKSGEEKDLMGYVGFITPKETEPASSCLQHHKDWATQLRQALYDKGRGVTRWNKLSWANQFRQLETTDGLAAARISEVLAWYCENLGGEYVPQAFAAESFRRKFVAIENAMQRHKAATKTYTLAGPQKVLYDKVAIAHWPNGALRDVPKLIAETYSRYETWWIKFQSFITIQGRDSQLSEYQRQNLLRFAMHVRTDLARPDVFTAWWVGVVQRKLSSWEGWDGSLHPYIWKTDHPMFTKALTQWSKEWSGETKWADLLLATIK